MWLGGDKVQRRRKGGRAVGMEGFAEELAMSCAWRQSTKQRRERSLPGHGEQGCSLDTAGWKGTLGSKVFRNLDSQTGGAGAPCRCLSTGATVTPVLYQLTLTAVRWNARVFKGRRLTCPGPALRLWRCKSGKRQRKYKRGDGFK